MKNEGLLQAILENPEDDAPRLIYADWLEENGDPGRAEFIRLGCMIEKAPKGEYKDLSHKQWLEGIKRAEELLYRNFVDWTPQPWDSCSPYRLNVDAQLSEPIKFEFRRGFVHTVYCGWSIFNLYWKRWAREHPLQILGIGETRWYRDGDIWRMS